MARRRTKPGLLRIAGALSAIYQVTGARALDNSVTRAFQGALPDKSQFPGGTYGKAVTMAVGPMILAREMNKLGYNPSLGPVRLL